MPEYISATLQTVEENNNILFDSALVPCNKGYVVHRNGAGITTLRGIINGYNNCNQFARYKINFGANIGIPAGGTVGEISVAISISGEELGYTEMIVTPAAVEEFFNVSRTTIVDVPKNCCVNVAVKNTSDQAIEVQNANLVIERIS